ncbi:MAG: hypothetical protein NTY75_04115 [Candidatus Shapirobacteria bacterium]|nr:hypothetical protein [Candidatus Shapirobacteria bacterium]
MKNIMTKNQLIIGIVGLTLLVVLIILLTGGNKKNTTEITPTITPTSAPYKSDTGAVLITPNPSEQITQTQTSILRNKAPIDTDTFILDFDWKNIYFTVKPKNANFQMFEVTKWLDTNGYGAIPINNFKVIK